MVKRLLFMFIILLLTACDEKDPVIGAEHISIEGGKKVVLKLHYFDSIDDANEYYQEKKSLNYFLMTHPEKDEGKVFKQIDSKEENGIKTVKLNTENEDWSEVEFKYLFEKLNLEIRCAKQKGCLKEANS